MKNAIKKLAIVTALLGTACAWNIAEASGTVQHPVADSIAKFDNQIASGTVILDFFASWCGPCQNFGPVFTSAAKKHTNILFIKINIDNYPKITKQFGVRSIPTIIALKDGKRIKSKTGFMNAAQFDAWINGLK